MDGPLVFHDKLELPSWIMQKYGKNSVFPFTSSDDLFWHIESYFIIIGRKKSLVIIWQDFEIPVICGGMCQILY